jgi:hypothetical protein
MSPTTTHQSSNAGRVPKPRTFVMPVVRPVPPRPTSSAAGTW